MRNRIAAGKTKLCVIKEFRCYEKSKKAGSRRELNPQHLWLEPPMLCHWAMTAGQPPAITILYMYCTGGTECLSHTPSNHSVCTVCTITTLLGINRKILSIRREPMLSGFLTLNAQSILPHNESKGVRCYEAKIEESEKADSHRESNPGHIWLEPPVLCHWAMTARQPCAHCKNIGVTSTIFGHLSWMPVVYVTCHKF